MTKTEFPHFHWKPYDRFNNSLGWGAETLQASQCDVVKRCKTLVSRYMYTSL